MSVLLIEVIQWFIWDALFCLSICEFSLQQVYEVANGKFTGITSPNKNQNSFMAYNIMT